jgi:pimeloyl-ACP methyl ester carboxylesterase
MAELAVNGATIAYDDVGTGDPAFVFIHGWLSNRSVWRLQVADLSRDLRCLNVDLRGSGDSSRIPPFDAATAVEDVAAVIRHAGVAPAVIVGHSFGSLVALLLNYRHPELVLGVAMGDPPLTAASAGRLGDAVAMVSEAGSMEVMRPLVESFFAASTPAEVRREVSEMALATPVDVAAGMLSNAEVFRDQMTELIQAADLKPFMAIWAATPRGNPEALRERTRFLRQEPVAEAGHFFQLDRPELTNALLRAFVDDVRRDPRLASSQAERGS